MLLSEGQSWCSAAIPRALHTDHALQIELVELAVLAQKPGSCPGSCLLGH